MSKSAGKEEVSIQLEETIEKLESILSQIQTQRDIPSMTLVKRLVVTTEAIERSVTKTKSIRSLWQRLSLFIVTALILAVIGLGVYFLKPSITPQVVQPTPSLPLDNSPLPTSTEEKTSTESTVTEEKPVTESILTPEQAFLAGIQESITTLSNKLQVDLIQSVKVDFNSSSLSVKIESTWYDLTYEQQDNLAQDIWQRSQSLAFRKLELVDFQEKVIARSPVVGNKMIILQRSNQMSIPEV